MKRQTKKRGPADDLIRSRRREIEKKVKRKKQYSREDYYDGETQMEGEGSLAAQHSLHRRVMIFAGCWRS